MEDKLKNLNIDIKYKNDSYSRNKFIEFLIDFLVNNTDLAGEFVCGHKFEEGLRDDQT